MSQNRIPIRYDTLVHLSCDDGYVTAEGLGDKALFMRRENELGDDAEVLPLLGFETSVFQLLNPATTSRATPGNEVGTGVFAQGTKVSSHSVGSTYTATEVTFGQPFLLVHVVSRLQVSVLLTEPSERDPDCARLVLVPPGEIEQTFCEFIFMPRYTTHSEGDIVCRGDEVLVRLASIPVFLHSTAVPRTQPATSGTSEAIGCTDGLVDACGVPCAAPDAPEVNISEAKALVFVVDRYDVDRDKAEYQRALHKIPRPCVPAGVPVIFYHLEHKRVLATSVAMPQCYRDDNTDVRGVNANEVANDTEHAYPLKTRQIHQTAGSVTMMRHASEKVVSDGPNSGRSGSSSTGGSHVDAGTSGALAHNLEKGRGADGLALPLFVVDRCVTEGTFSEEGALTGLHCSCTAMWILENEQPMIGGVVSVQAVAYRLRQACSNLYLAVEGSAVDTILEEDSSCEGTLVPNRSGSNLTGSSINMGETDVVRPTSLCMIPQPRTPKDLQRTLFLVSPMFNSECGYLIENDCLLLQNVVTDMYVCTMDGDGSLSVAWKPSNVDLIVVRKAAADVQDSVLFLWHQCEALRRYRDAFQALTSKMSATDQKRTEMKRERAQDRLHSAEGPLKLADGAGGVGSPPDYDHVLESFVKPRTMNPQSASIDSGYAPLLPVIHACQRTLAELIMFCSESPERNVLRRDGIPIPRHQRMLMELNVNRLVLDVILAPLTKLGAPGEQAAAKNPQYYRQWGCSSLPPLPLAGGVIRVSDVLLNKHREVHTACRLAFRLLRQMVRQAAELKAGFDTYIPYFLTLSGRKFRVGDTLTRLMSENPAVGNPCLENVVNHCVANIRLVRSGGYLQLLGSICSVEARGVTERQRLVCRRLLVENGDLLCHFILDDLGEWAIVTGKRQPAIPCKSFFDQHQIEGVGDKVSSQLREYVQCELELLVALCLDGCPPLCREEVAKVFPPVVLLRALHDYAGGEREEIEEPSIYDIVCTHLIRLAMHCYIIPRIDDPAVLLHGNSVLLGSSKLHFRAEKGTVFSGRANDELVQIVKETTFHTIRNNPHFIQSNTARSALICAALTAWLRFVTAHQISAVEITCMVPLLLNLLDSREDELHNGNSKIAEYTWTRIEVSEAGLQVVRAREMVCRILLRILDAATNRAANEMNVLLHQVLEWGRGSVKTNEPGCGPQPGKNALASTEGFVVVSPTEKDALLSHRNAPSSSHGGSCLDVTGSEWHKDYKSMDTCNVVVVEPGQGARDTSDLMNYLKEACSCVVRMFCAEQLVPRLVDLSRHSGTHLAPCAMELLVKICTVRRTVARRVLQVHPSPSSEVIQCFDNMYFVAVQVRSLCAVGSREEAIDVALRGIEGSASQSGAQPPNREGEVVSKCEDGCHEDLTEDDGEIEEFDVYEEHEEAETGLPACAGKWGAGGESKARRLWSKAASAARIVVYRNAIIARRRSVGLSETSSIPLRVVVRAETVRHWHIHLTMLEVYPFLNPSTPNFNKWMRFFYVFTLSHSNAQSLRTYIDLFMGALTANGGCTVMGLHIVLNILSTIKDPTPYLTDSFLRESVRYIDGEIAAPHPDSEFATKLGLYIFTKTTVGGIPRRRTLQLLRDYDAFRCLPSPGVAGRHGKGRFVACIVEMVCRICGTSMGAVALGRSALPMAYLLENIVSNGTSYTPLSEEPRRRTLWESNQFHLLGAYLLALVSLYIAAGNGEGGGGRRQWQMEWMANRGWWSVVLLLSRQLGGLAQLLRSEMEDVLWRGRRVLQRYRRLWLVYLPLALLTFMTECFNEAGLYRYRDNTGVTFRKMCMSVAEFSEVLLANADAVRLRTREMVGYRRLVALLQVQTQNLVDHDLLAGIMLDTRRELRRGVIRYYEKINEAHQRFRGSQGGAVSQDNNAPQGDDDDGQDSLMAAMDTSIYARDEVDVSPPTGLLISGAATRCLEVERLRDELRALVKRDQLISMEDSMSPNEPAGILNALLMNCQRHSNTREFVSNVFKCMQQRSFGSVTTVGVLDVLSNTLRITLNEQRREQLKHVGAENSSMIADIFTVRSFETDYAKENAGNLLQTAFSDLGATRAIASLCAVDDQVVAYSAVRLCVGILDGGNKNSQKTLLAYFHANQEKFFHNIRDMIHKTTDWIRRSNAEHQIVVLERGGVVPNISNAHEFTLMLLSNALTTSLLPYSNLRTGTLRDVMATGRQLSAWDQADGGLHQRFVCTLFRMLQLFCEGHNLSMQNYIRSQYDNLHNVNAVHEVMNLIAQMAAVVHPTTVRMLQSGFALLTELCQGPCHENQEALLGYGVCGVVCTLLMCLNPGGTPQTSTAGDAPAARCSLDGAEEEGSGLSRLQGGLVLNRNDAGKLRVALTECLLSLIEGCRSPDIFCEIMQQIPVEVIERELTTVDPETYDNILESEQLAGEPGVEALFNWLIFLKTVKPYAEEDYLRRIDKMLQRTNKLCYHLGFIEIQRVDGMLETVMFRIPHIWRGLTRRNRKQMLARVNCSSRAAKLGDFMYHSDNVIFEVERSYAFQCWVERHTRWRLRSGSSCVENSDHSVVNTEGVTKISSTRCSSGWRQCTEAPKLFWNHFMAPVLFCTQLSFYEYTSLLVAAVLNVILIHDEGRRPHTEESQFRGVVVLSLCVLQFALSLVALTVDTIVFFPVTLYIHYRQKQQRFSGRAKFNETLRDVLRGLSAKEISLLLVTRFSFQFRLLLVGMALLSIFISHYFAAAHLMLMVYTFPTLRTFVRAITHNGRQLLLTALLGIMGLYLFAIAGRIMFPEQFGSNDEGDGDARKEGSESGNCDTLLRCFTFILWQGLRQGGGVGDVMDEVSWNSPTLMPRVSYDLIFFALVNVVFLNIMFGIIIDTFGELRDDRRERENDLKSTCFICGLDADTLEKSQVGGFRAHVKEAHNMWMYLYFIHYLRHKDPNNFTGQESYVHEKIQKNDLSFFPEEDCIALQKCKEVKDGKAGDNDEDSGDECAGSAAPRGPRPDAAVSASGMKLVLKELAAVRDAVGSLARETAMEGERTRGLAQQLELINRSSKGTSVQQAVGGRSTASGGETTASKMTRVRHYEAKHPGSTPSE